MKELTLEQAVVISGYTGLLACSFDEFHKDVEERLGRPVWTHELGRQALWDELKEIYKSDFLALCHKQVKETL